MLSLYLFIGYGNIAITSFVGFEKMNKSQRILVIFFCILSLLLSVTIPIRITSASSTDYPLHPSDEIITKAVEFLKHKQNEDGSIGGFAVSAWAAIAISTTNENLTNWTNLLHYLRNSLNLIEENRVTDWERMVLAIVAFNQNPRNFTGTDFIEKIENFFDGNQIGDPSNLYDDIFGILALISAGVDRDSPIIQNVQLHIRKKQNSDGGWGDVDTTAAAVMALVASGESTNSFSIHQALSFLKSNQRNNGGFNAWGTTNTASTAWAVNAIVAAGDDPTSKEWEKDGTTPIDFLISMQRKDGGFNWSENQNMNPEWMTAYVIPALLGKPYPVKVLEIQENPDEEDEYNNSDDDAADANETDNDDVNNQNDTSDESLPIQFVTPEDHSVYVFDKKMNLHSKHITIIGPLTIKLQATTDIKKIILYIDYVPVFTATNPPFEWFFNTYGFFHKKTITIKAFPQENSSSIIKNQAYHVYQYIKNISALSKRLHVDHLSPLLKQNITSLRRLISKPVIVIEKKIIHVNLFPKFHRIPIRRGGVI